MKKVKINNQIIINGFLLFILIFLNCAIPKKDSIEYKINNSLVTKIEITGIAYNRKGGAIVDSKSIHYWIDSKEFWDDRLLTKKVIVKGLLEIREDNPVFIDNSEIKSQGIPVSSEEELKGQKKRFWILKPQVKVIE